MLWSLLSIFGRFPYRAAIGARPCAFPLRKEGWSRALSRARDLLELEREAEARPLSVRQRTQVGNLLLYSRPLVTSWCMYGCLREFVVYFKVFWVVRSVLNGVLGSSWSAQVSGKRVRGLTQVGNLLVYSRGLR